jgi:hypothetical protein
LRVDRRDVLREAVRRPLEFLADDPPRLGELAPGELERLGLDDREEGRLVDPDREGLDRFTLEPLWAERPPPPRDPPPPPPRCA